MSKGWECPKCGKIYAPFMPECGCCNTHVTNNSNIDVDWTIVYPDTNSPNELPLDTNHG